MNLRLASRGADRALRISRQVARLLRRILSVLHGDPEQPVLLFVAVSSRVKARTYSERLPRRLADNERVREPRDELPVMKPATW